MSILRTAASLLVLLGAMSVAGPVAAAPGYGVAMHFADEEGKVTPTLFTGAEGTMDSAVCKARLDYLTKKFYRMVRANLPEFDGQKLVKSECVQASAFDLKRY
jgi:hypothetical protein